MTTRDYLLDYDYRLEGGEVKCSWIRDSEIVDCDNLIKCSYTQIANREIISLLGSFIAVDTFLGDLNCEIINICDDSFTIKIDKKQLIEKLNNKEL